MIILKAFSSFHPTVLLLYYVSVFIVSVCTMHPVVIGCSVLGSLLFFIVLNPLHEIIKEFVFYAFAGILIAVVNLLFAHRGETILFFMNDNPITYESGMFGIALACMILSIAFWSKSYIDLVSTDKIIYLFGSIIPRLAIFVSMVFRFMPMFKKQLKKVNQAQKTLGFYTSDSITDRVIGGIRVFKSTFISELELFFSKTDAMKARGYGLKGRTNFSIFKWQIRDIIIGIFIILLVGVTVGGRHAFYFYYDPVVADVEISYAAFFQYVCVFLLMIIPSIIEVKENLQWRFLMSRI